MNQPTDKSVLAVAAHPDDVEFVMAGTLLLLQRAGWRLHYFNIANGCCGSSTTGRAETARVRAAEARAAAESLGAEFHESISDDLAIFYDAETLAKVAAVVRRTKPSIVLTHSPVDYMEDHMNACRLAVTAAFARGMPNFPTDPASNALEGTCTVYHAQPHGNRDPFGEVVRPHFAVDVGEVMQRKDQALACHVSQKQWLDDSQGMDSYLQAMRDLNAEVGALCGCDYAEGWRRRLHLGFCGPDDDPLRQALAPYVREPL